MGDGSQREGGYILCTENFQEIEVKWLIVLLYIKYGIESHIRWNRARGHPRLYIPARSRMKLEILVEPYIVESQRRKLILKTPRNTRSESKSK